MQKIETIQAMKDAADALRRGGRQVALVPTSGALHAGHVSLIKTASEKAQSVVLSAFVNPLQFGPSEDLAKYPRPVAADAMLAEKEGVTVLFTPTVDEMYPRGFSSQVVEEAVSKPLCGISRPTHFRGVLTGWLKLLNIVRPDVLVMGEKDPQQIAVVRKVVADLLIPVEIVTVPLVRDADGLAVSARNSYLSPTQREEALAVYGALQTAREMVANGVKSTDRLVAEVTHLIAEKRRLRVIYISIVDSHSMEQLRELTPGQCLLAISYWVDEVRLTDSIPL